MYINKSSRYRSMQVKCCKMLHARVLCVCLTSACPGYSIAVLSGVLAEVGLKFAQSAQHCTAVQIRTNGTGDAVGLLVSKGAEDLQNVSVPSLYKASSRFCEDLDETREMLTAEHGILAWKAGIAVLCRRCAVVHVGMTRDTEANAIPSRSFQEFRMYIARPDLHGDWVLQMSLRTRVLNRAIGVG